MKKTAILLSLLLFAVPVYGAEQSNYEFTPDEGYEETVTDEPGFFVDPQQSEINTALITVSAKMPEGFTLNAFADIENEETGSVYEIQLIPSNNYNGKGYVPAGHYTITQIGVYDDTTSQYPMSIPDDNTFRLNDYDQHAITSECLWSEKTENTEEDISPEEPASEQNTQDENEVLPWRKIKGNAHGASYSGTSNGEYDIVVIITHSGSYYEGMFKVSYDNGETFSREEPIQESIHLIRKTDKGEEDTGLIFHFPDYRYQLEEKFSFSTEKEWAASNGISPTSDIYFGGYPDLDCDIVLNIVEEGEPGKGSFKLSRTGGQGFRDEKIIPSSMEYKIDGLIIRFKKMNYVPGTVYTAKAKAEAVKNYDNMMYAIVFCTAVVIFISIYLYYFSKRANKSAYVIIRE